MLKKSLLTMSFILMYFIGIAQKNINDYKYIIVPKTFSFSNSEDQYQLNSLTKFLFNKYGFEAYFVDDDFPEDLKSKRCLALSSEVLKVKGGVFKTKLEIVLKDCYGAVVMTSQVGESRLKEFDKAYNEAIRNAFETFQKLDYEYVPKQGGTIETLEGDINNEIGEATATAAAAVSVLDNKTKGNSEIYYAQAIENGFQIVNAEPKTVMLLLTTAAENVFIVKGKNAIVFKADGFWYYSENNGTLSEKKLLNIKF